MYRRRNFRAEVGFDGLQDRLRRLDVMIQRTNQSESVCKVKERLCLNLTHFVWLFSNFN